MVRVKRANTEYRVPDEKLPEYLAMGYAQIDGSGCVLREGEKTGAGELRVENASLKEENRRLRAEYAALEERLSAPAASPDDPPKAGKKG